MCMVYPHLHILASDIWQLFLYIYIYIYWATTIKVIFFKITLSLSVFGLYGGQRKWKSGYNDSSDGYSDISTI